MEAWAGGRCVNRVQGLRKAGRPEGLDYKERCDEDRGSANVGRGVKRNGRDQEETKDGDEDAHKGREGFLC